MKFELTNFCEIDKHAIESYCRIHHEDKSKNLGDITAIEASSIADCNVIVGGSPCLVGDSLVLTKDGYKQLIDVKPGDMVLSHDNQYHEVVRFMDQGVKPVYEVQAMGFDKIEATANHKFYVRKKESVWDNSRRTDIRVFCEPEWMTIEDLMKLDDKGVPYYKNYYMGTAINQESIIPQWNGVEICVNQNMTKIKNNLDLTDRNLWYLVGRFLGDGWLVKQHKQGNYRYPYSGVMICCSKLEVEELKSKISETYKYTISEERTVSRFCFQNVELTAFLEQFGFGAANKRLPGFVYDLPVDLLRALLDGYFDSDGCYIKKLDLQSFTSINKLLIYGISQCIAKAYNRPFAIYFDKRKPTCVIEGRTVNQKSTYMLRFHEVAHKQDKAFIENGIIWYPIKTIIDLNRSEPVYDIEVADSHSFVVNNCITHNCQDFSTAGKKKGAMWTCKDCGHEYNPLEVHYTKRNACPVCGSSELERTRSSLIVEYLRMIREKKPNFAVYENVKNLIGKEFKTLFDKFLDELHEYGYNTYYSIMNAKHYGIPQNRERVILVIIKKELDNGLFKFPEPFDAGIRLVHLLEDSVQSKYYLAQDKADRLLKTLSEESVAKISDLDNNGLSDVKKDIEAALNSNEDNTITNKICVACRGRNPENPNLRVSGLHTEQRLEPNWNGTTNTLTSVQKDNWVLEQEIIVDKGIKPCVRKNFEREKEQISKTDKEIYQCQCDGGWQDNKIGIKVSPTLRANNPFTCVYANCCIRRLTPLECFRLMGFTDEDFYNAQNQNTENYNPKKGDYIMSDTQLYKQAGNSIVTNVLYYTYKNLYKAMPYLFDDIKLLSLFSGIGAFEKAFYMLQEYIKNPDYIPIKFYESNSALKPQRVGQVSSENSQAGTVYSDQNVSPTLCAGSHGYAMGYILTENFQKPPTT